MNNYCRNVSKIQILFILFKLEPKTPVQHAIFLASIKMNIQIISSWQFRRVQGIVAKTLQQKQLGVKLQKIIWQIPLFSSQAPLACFACDTSHICLSGTSKGESCKSKSATKKDLSMELRLVRLKRFIWLSAVNQRINVHCTVM